MCGDIRLLLATTMNDAFMPQIKVLIAFYHWFLAYFYYPILNSVHAYDSTRVIHVCHPFACLRLYAFKIRILIRFQFNYNFHIVLHCLSEVDQTGKCAQRPGVHLLHMLVELA